jgi:hypothetical protein
MRTVRTATAYSQRGTKRQWIQDSEMLEFSSRSILQHYATSDALHIAANEERMFHVFEALTGVNMDIL